jgi:hypothetical protein
MISSQSSGPISSPNGQSVNLVFQGFELFANPKPYQIRLDAFWDTELGSTFEDTRTLSIQVVAVTFTVDYSPMRVDSGTSFNLTFRIVNSGKEIASNVTAALTSAGGFALENATVVSAGRMDPGAERIAIFRLSSGLMDLFQGNGSRKLTLTIIFNDWRGIAHAQTVDITVTLELTARTISHWASILAIPAGIVMALIIFLFLSVKMRINLRRTVFKKRPLSRRSRRAGAHA